MSGAAPGSARPDDHPEVRFGTPERLLAADLGADEKREILERWRDEENALVRASTEGMQGGEQPMLARVQRALERLLERLDEETRPKAHPQGPGGAGL